MQRAENEIRDQIVTTARELYELGQNAPPDGNISVRLDEQSLICSPTACHKGRMKPSDLVKVDIASGEANGGRASTEIKMHLLFYREREDVGAIVHAHCPHAVALTLIGVDMRNAMLAESLYYLGDVPTVPYQTPSTMNLVDAIREHALDSKVFLLERHGVVALGKDIEEARTRLEVLEHSAKIMLLALGAGKPSPLSKAEQDEIRALMNG